MRKIGGYMVFFGLGTIILNLVNMEFVLFSWIDSWGETTSWAIKIGFIVIGAVLYFMGKPSDESEETTE